MWRSTQAPRPQGEQKGPQAIPTKTQPSLQTITELGETTVAVVEQLPRFRPWCGPELQVMRPRVRGLWCRGDGRALHPAPPCPTRSARPHSRGGRPGSRDGWREPSAVRRLRHTTTPSRNRKTGQCGLRTPLGARSLSFASYSPSADHGQRKRPDRPPAPRDTARSHHASLHVRVKREQGASRPEDGAPARTATSSTCTDSGGLAKPRSLERGYCGNGDPGAWSLRHRRSGAEDPLPARSEAPTMEGLGEMLVDPSEQLPHGRSAAPPETPRIQSSVYHEGHPERFTALHGEEKEEGIRCYLNEMRWNQ